MKNSDDLKQLMNKNFTKEEVAKLEMEAQISGSITKLRLEAGLTQKQLAKKAGVNQSAIARIENDDSIPRVDTFIKICNALDHKIEIVECDFKRQELISNKDICDMVNETRQLIGRLDRRQESLEISFKTIYNKFDKLITEQSNVENWFSAKQFKPTYDSQRFSEMPFTRGNSKMNQWSIIKSECGGN